MLDKLIKLANELDQRGYTKEASRVDVLIKKNAGRHELFRALKNDDIEGAINSLSRMNNEDLGITTQEFKFLTKDLMDAKSYEAHDPAESANSMEKARQILGIEKPVQQTTQTHNPITGLPWSSGPTNIQLEKELLQLKSIINPHRGAADTRSSIDVRPAEDYISILAGLAFKPDDLVKKLDKAGYKKHMPDGEMATRSKIIGKDRIVIDVDILQTAVPTQISISPMSKENYDAIVKVFGSGQEQSFDEAVKEYDEYMKQPDFP